MAKVVAADKLRICFLAKIGQVVSFAFILAFLIRYYMTSTLSPSTAQGRLYG
jgi:hypothetical protein